MTTVADLDLARYLRLLAGPSPRQRFLNIRYVNPAAAAGMSQRFIPATALGQAAHTITSKSRDVDVYCGVLLRARRAGGNDAVTASHLLWAEIDTPTALGRLLGAETPPTMTIASGTPGHLHAYWRLAHPLDATYVPEYNRRLADTFDADSNAIDAARILRPPGTTNHKTSPARPVEILDADPHRVYHLGEILDSLPRPMRRPAIRAHTAHSDRVAVRDLDRRLLAIAGEDYARQLTGQTPTREGKICCPFHEDHTPSLHLYPDGTWYCYGTCQTGGSVYDFAARLWGQGTKGREFIELRRRLADELLAEAVPR